MWFYFLLAFYFIRLYTSRDLTEQTVSLWILMIQIKSVLVEWMLPLRQVSLPYTLHSTLFLRFNSMKLKNLCRVLNELMQKERFRKDVYGFRIYSILSQPLRYSHSTLVLLTVTPKFGSSQFLNLNILK